jgi:hypothetical protein
MKRLALLAVVGLLVALTPAVAGAGAPAPTGGPGITIVHGIGPAPQPVDVYLGETDAEVWELALPDFQFGEVITIPVGDGEDELPAGGYNVLICAPAAAVPTEFIASCQDNGSEAVNGNFGTNVDAEEGVDEMWIAAYGEPGFGRPTVLEVEVDLDCVEADAPARVTAVHAATAPEVDVLAAPAGVDPVPVIEDLAWGESDSLDVPEGSYDVAVELTDGTPVLEVPDFELEGLVNTAAIAVGNPQFDAAFDVLVITFPLEECTTPTTPTTAAPTTTTAKAAAAAATPRFTG